MSTPDPAVILITGTSRGIGRQLAEHYAAQGHRVIGCSRGNTQPLPGDYRHFQLDVTDEPTVKKMFAEIRGQYGRWTP